MEFKDELKLFFNSQLLATALKHEKPELELRKSELLKVEEEHKLEIGRLEDFLLEELANATGNLLENKELLASLNETKAKSASIKVSKVNLLKVPNYFGAIHNTVFLHRSFIGRLLSSAYQYTSDG